MSMQASSLAGHRLWRGSLEVEQLYELLLRNAAHEASFLTSLDGEILSWNSGVQQILGYSEQEFVGRNLAVLFDEERQTDFVTENLIATAIREGMKSETGWHLRSNHLPVYSTCVLRVVRDGCGREALAVVLRDASLEKRAEEERKQELLALQQSNEDLSRVGHILSHDLRAPLRMIGTYLTLLVRDLGERLDDTSRECIKYVLEGVGHMDQLVASLDRYAQVGATAIAAAAVDLEEVLHKTLTFLNLNVSENDAVVTHDRLPVVQGDSTLLIELFQNLIANALKYRKPETPRIHISAQEGSEEWILSVRDNGMGIDPRFAEQIFLPMTRLHGSGIAGSGTGLAVSKSIAERHHGRIWVESAVGLGSTFYFSLPKMESAQ